MNRRPVRGQEQKEEAQLKESGVHMRGAATARDTRGPQEVKVLPARYLNTGFGGVDAQFFTIVTEPS